MIPNITMRDYEDCNLKRLYRPLYLYQVSLGQSEFMFSLYLKDAIFGIAIAILFV
jgi:hypothetical protein